MPRLLAPLAASAARYYAGDPPGAVALVSFAPFNGADAALVAAVLTLATYCMVFLNSR